MSLMTLSQNLKSDYKEVYDRAYLYASVQGLILEENQNLNRKGAADRTEVHQGEVDNIRF